MDTKFNKTYNYNKNLMNKSTTNLNKTNKSFLVQSKDIGKDDRFKVRDYNKMVNKIHETNSNFSVLEDKYNTLNAQFASKNREYNVLRDEKNLLIKRLEQYNADYTQVSKDKSLLENRLHEYGSDFDKLKKLNTKLENELKVNYKKTFD